MVDRLRNYTVATAILVAAAGSGCQLVGPDGSVTVLGVSAGDSFGECLGYCRTLIDATPTRIAFTTEGWSLEGGSLPTLRDTTAMEGAFWTHLVSVASSVPVQALDSVYGCPDCTDGGAEWIEIMVAGQDPRRITFEFGNAPQELTSLSDTLRTLRRDHWKARESD